MFQVDRRNLFRGALAASVIPFAARAEMAPARGFTHNVASGDPSATSVVLWTRYVPAGGRRVRLRAEVSEDESFRRIAGRQSATLDPARDWCVTPALGGLKPGRTYFYRFVASDGAVSPVGRTKTLPDGRPERFTVAIFSCSNLPFGFFNAYAHAAARDDIDLALHLGDYTYEYERGRYPTAAEAMPGREIWPEHETIRLADYRQRLATYRADPDLAAVHARLPFLTTWDDHELANNTWKGGAEEHDPTTEGPWPPRLKAAQQAYFEWLPMRTDPWRAYQVGDLLTLYRLETRISGRDLQLDLARAVAAGPDPMTALSRFRDGPWADPGRQMLGSAQEAWLARGLERSAGAGTRWQFLMQQVLMGWQFTPPETLQWLPPGAPEAVRNQLMMGVAATRIGLPVAMDMWAGYPAAKARLLAASRRAGASLVTCAGDSHNAWAFELADAQGPAGVEFGTTSVSAPGAEVRPFRVTPPDFARALVAASPELKWCDTSRRGYTTIVFERDRVTANFHLLQTVRERSTALAETRTIVSERGSNRLSL